ncbi:MAG: Nucleotidyl transferase [Parcubacteria group bacterium GW2011_GWC2_45_7]|nr:MAG: Nucleotidyl transferase [Parcubacteria group bacterium GW2011_GWC2_45_7]KKU74131.1 MAG: Nucleotidyl transferase [Parcubacteria group bacterium GW2011_GWA2_47_26]
MIDDLNSLFVGEDSTIKGAMKQMDKTAKKILFVADEDCRLLGTITDGDIRRWILMDGDLRERVDKIYNKEPVYIEDGISKKDVRKRMLETGVHSLPVVDGDKRIMKVIFWEDVAEENIEEINKKYSALNVPVIIMAGGKGSRLDPFTKILPKALIPIGDKPAVEVIIDNFLQYIAGDIYLILNHKREMIKSYFDNNSFNYRIKYIDEGEDPLGTVGGLQFLPKDFPDTFFLSNCDTIIKARYDEIYTFHKENMNDLTIVGSMQQTVIPYGVVKINSGGELSALEEKPAYDFIANTGMYVLEKIVLQYLPIKELCDIPHLIKMIRERGGKVGVYPVSEKSWSDIGQWESYGETVKGFNL